jgi:hypothetical protein
MEPITKTITIRTVAGPKRVRAQVFGQLAVHRKWNESPQCQGRVNITHIPTGLCVIERIPPNDALELVQELGVLDWGSYEPMAARELASAAGEIIERFFAARCARDLRCARTAREFRGAIWRSLPREWRSRFAQARSKQVQEKLLEQAARQLPEEARAALAERGLTLGEAFQGLAAEGK